MSAAADGPSRPLAPRADGVVSGLALAVLGTFLFGANNAVMKQLIASYPVPEAIACRSALSLVMLMPFLRPAEFRSAWRRSPPALHLLRMTMSALEMTCFFLALARIPMADVSTLYLATPIYVTAMSPLMLGERVGWRRWAAVLVGFGGVLLALRPTATAISPAAAIAVGGAVMYSLVVVTTRKLRGASNGVLIALQLVAALLVSLAQANGGWLTPRPADLAVMVGGSAISVAGYAAFNQSLRLAPASVVAPVQYTSLIWAAAFGVLLFDETPSSATVAGALVIIGAGLFIFWRERSRAKLA